jgi:hypothetical protein
MSNQKDIGDKCISCFKDTSFGSGLFVNRIPALGDLYDGYLCPDCQMVECRRCDKKALEYEIIEGEFVCMDCLTIQEVA